MASEPLILNAFMASLISSIGGYEAAVAVLSARWGKGVSKGTLTKKLQGDLDWSVLDVMALQEAARATPVWDWVTAQGVDADAQGCIAQGTVDFAREVGEAIGQLGAVLAAPKDAAAAAKAIKEVRDVLDAGARLIEGLE